MAAVAARVVVLALGVLVLAALMWGTVVLSVAHWPGVTTRAEVRAAFDRVQFDQVPHDPTVREHGSAWCSAGAQDLLGCPWLQADYMVGEGEADMLIDALHEAGFHAVAQSERVAVDESGPFSPRHSSFASRHWLKGAGMRVEVTVRTDREMVLSGPGNLTTYVPTGTELVSVEMSDARDDRRGVDLDDLGFWSPDASLDHLEPPPGW